MISDKVKNWLKNCSNLNVKRYHPYRIDNVLVMFGETDNLIAYPNNENKLIFQNLNVWNDGYSILDKNINTSNSDIELLKEFNTYVEQNAIPVENRCTHDIIYFTTPWKTLPDDICIWNQLDEKTKKLIQKEYSRECTAYQLALEKYFGKDNLVPPPPINTWKDLIKVKPELDNKLNSFIESIEDLVIRDSEYLISQFKIIHLINHGYGGIINKREWQNQDILKWRIVVNSLTGNPTISSTVHDTGELLTFRTKELAERFKNYNIDLINNFLKR